MAKLLEGKVAIVTGAGRGLGREEALGLAKEGAAVVVNDYGGGFDGTGGAKSPADEVVAEIKAFGGKAVANYESVADFQGAKRIIDCAINNFGKLNILVNNAGILRDRIIFNMSEEDWDAVMAVHMKGTFNCTRHACAYWREQSKEGKTHNGKIINTTSDAGLGGNPGQANYGAAKAGIAALTIIVGKEMARSQVCVNCVAPLARTRLTTDATPTMKGFMEKSAEAEFDMMHPANMAPLVVWLASDQANDVNCQVFRLRGDTIDLFEGWHVLESASKGKKRWEVGELNPVIHGMLAKHAPAEKKSILR